VTSPPPTKVGHDAAAGQQACRRGASTNGPSPVQAARVHDRVAKPRAARLAHVGVLDPEPLERQGGELCLAGPVSRRNRSSSGSGSKWSSIARFPRPRHEQHAAGTSARASSSTTCWTTGRPPTGQQLLGLRLGGGQQTRAETGDGHDGRA